MSYFHPSLLNQKASASVFGESEMTKPQFAQRDKSQEEKHIERVTTRGEGLSDVLWMKKQFDRYMSKVSNSPGVYINFYNC